MALSSLDDLPGESGVNPIAVSVIGSAFDSIVEEMGESLVRASYSTNIKERRDCSTAIFDARGEMLCQAEHIPLHLGSFLSFVPLVLERYAAEDIEPGDVFIGNDAYEGGGTHLPDIVIAEPVFYEGAIISWAINTAHHSDFVDRGDAHIYQEGIRIPPIRLYRAGVLQKDVEQLILLNCQVPLERLSDFRAQRAANRLGITRMLQLYDKYGVDTVVKAGIELQNYAERKIRAGIRNIPDGVYRFKDSFEVNNYDQVMEFGVTIRVEGGEIHLDFQSPKQVRANINVVYTALLASVFYAIKTVIDPHVPSNSGIARPIHVTAEPGTLLNCIHPAAVATRHSACQRVVDLVHGALAQAVPDRVTAASNGSCFSVNFIGQRPDKSTWIYIETIGGGNGARHNKDGLDGVHVHMTNTSNLPVEALEVEFPISVMCYELIDDSGGAGRYRGGMGLRRVYRAEAPCRVRALGSRIRTKPWGIDGGLEGASGDCRFYVGAGPETRPGAINNVEVGDHIEVLTPGAGGFGAPEKRSDARIAEDIESGVFSIERAREVYGAARLEKIA